MTIDIFIETVLSEASKLQRIGKGVNKCCFKLPGNEEWVILASSKKNLIQNELNQLRLIESRCHSIPTQTCSDVFKSIVPQISSDVFNFIIDNQPCSAFVEQFIKGFDMPHNYATSDEDVRTFYNKITDDILSTQPLENAKAKQKTVTACLTRIFKYLQEYDIPDLQLRYETATGKVFVIDPGDANSGNYHAKHKQWISKIMEFTSESEMKRMWNYKNKKEKWL